MSQIIRARPLSEHSLRNKYVTRSYKKYLRWWYATVYGKIPLEWRLRPVVYIEASRLQRLYEYKGVEKYNQ